MIELTRRRGLRPLLHLRPLKRARSMKPVFNLKIVILILLISFFLVFNLTGFSKNIKNIFFLISSPIQKTFWQAGNSLSDFIAGIWKAKSLENETEFLRQKNQELISQIIELKELEKENKTLRETLGIGLEKEFQLELSRIISKDISQDSILIDKGSKDGIPKGLPVITSQKVLLGIVGEVYESFLEVILITNKEISFEAKIFEKEIYGAVRGRGSLKLYLDLIPKNKEISQGDIVITTALGGLFPAGLLVGEIETVKKSDVEPFQTAEMRPLFNVKDLDYLFIIK